MAIVRVIRQDSDKNRPGCSILAGAAPSTNGVPRLDSSMLTREIGSRFGILSYIRHKTTFRIMH